MKRNLLIGAVGAAFIGSILISQAQTTPFTLVVPRVNEILDGSATDGGGSTLFQERLRLQAVYESGLFPSNKVLTIRELRYRPATFGGHAFTATVSNLQINLSTTRSNANGLSATFANNVGSDNTVGFQGAITLSSAFTGPTGGPKDFDIRIPLTTPFRYNPANGNLLIDVRNSSGSSASWIDAGGRIDDGASRAISLDPNGTTAVTRDKAAEVVQLVYTEDTPPPLACFVVPPGLESRNAFGGGTSTLDEPHRMQQVYNGSMFPSQPIRITEVRFRPHVGLGGAFTTTVSNIEFRFSTTQRRADNLSLTFSNNIGPDETVVFSGSLDISSRYSGPAAGPKDFDIILHFQRPFVFNPAAGNLLFDVRNFSGSGASTLDGEGVGGDGVSRLISLDVSAPSGGTDSGADVLQICYEPVSPPPPPNSFDVARDFSIDANPNGAWSYGSENNLGGTFELLPTARHLTAGNGVELLSWSVAPTTSPAVYYNGTTQTATTDGGAGVFPPGTFWFEVGWNSTPQSFGVTRFTVPAGAGGTYRLESVVQPHLNGASWTPGHFYILRDSAALFDRLVLPDTSAGYSNLVGLAAGDTIDFVIGRGPSDQPTAMKLQARLVQVSTNQPPPPPPAYFVVPVGLDTREGNGGSASLGEPLRLQEVYRASDFPATVIRITELRFRPSVDSGTGAFSNVIPNIVLRLSTTPRQPDSLSTTFAQNIGADETTVYSGALPIQSRFGGPASGPKDFDIVVHLQQPFVYNPAAGNLLFDIQNISGAPVRYVVDAEGSQDGASRVISLNPNAPTASTADTGADVLAIVYDLVSPPPPPSFVVPAGLATREGNGGSSSLSEPLRLQEVYRAADFPANVIRITELRLRPSVDFGTGAFSDVVSNIVLKLSTTQKQPDSLSTTFAQNIGSDETVVYSGALPIRSQFTGPAGGPKDFDIVIHLQHPFVYDPAAGNLLLDIQNFSGAPVRYVVDAEGSADGASRVISLDPNSASAITADTGADVLAIIYQVVAETRPTITSQPQSRTVNAGSSVVFNVLVSGSQPLTYQWYRNTSLIPGATNNTLTLNNVQPANAGTYSVVISNAAGSIRSADATLTVLTGPRLVVPAGLATREGNGGSSSLSEPLRLQEVYRAADFPRSMIRISELRFRPSVDFGTGAFSDVVPNITLKLSTTTRQPDNLSRTFAQNIGADETIVYSGALPIQSQFSGPAGGPKDFDIVVQLQRPFIYNPAAGNLLFDIQNFNGARMRWVVDAEGSQDGASRVISLDPSSSTAITADTGADVLAIGYEVVSEVAPIISSQPQSRTVLAGSAVTFSVGASGSQPLTYQWRRNGTPISGANSATLTLNNVQQGDAGAYSVVVANNAGSATSADATLSVIEGATLVVPSGLETREGNGGSASLSEQLRLQEVYGASQFPAGNLAISEIRFRPSVDAGTGPFSTTISNIQINLSTTQKQPDGLSTVFADNVGSNDTVVFSGPLSISTAFSGPAAGPKDFDIVVPLQTPFIYNPARGNLLVDIRNFSGLPVRYVVDAEGSADQASRVIARSATAPQAVTADSGADVLQIIYTVTNNPPIAKAIVSPTVDLSPKIPELLVIAVNGATATVSLDGSGSSDPDGDSLTYSWFANGDTTPFATGANAAASLEPGLHSITLVVSDGRTSASDTVEVEVITLPQMLDILVFLVDDSAVPRKAQRPLVTALKQAGNAIEGDRANVAINKLEQFQAKVAVQVAPIDPQTAEALIEAAEKVIEALRTSP